jgi:hypothetical protein
MAQVEETGGTSDGETGSMIESGKGQGQGDRKENGEPPALPPRLDVATSTRTDAIHTKRPAVRSRTTTALSAIDVQTVTFPDGTRETFSSAEQQVNRSADIDVQKPSQASSEIGDDASLTSSRPDSRRADLESLMGSSSISHTPAWKLLSSQTDTGAPLDDTSFDEDDGLSTFEHEFDEVPDIDSKGGNEEQCLFQWKSKLKHYLVLSSAGKPVYSRHGDQNLINSYIGIIQTIISFYEGDHDPLNSFTAGGARFAILTKGPLYFVAISRLGESDEQLRAQLEALYMQILSTLTLPTLTQMFSNRPSTDLRRPLQGTEPLLSSLADSFTKGSAPALLSALECLKLRKSQRHVINNILLKTRSAQLLYGLIVAGGRLVSVVRPKRHSLYPGDLQLIFNMLFEAGGIKAGGGENWIPLCLPGFNNTGYLYMYVNFLKAEVNGTETPLHTAGSNGTDDEVAIILISTDKESFYELKQMHDDTVAMLMKTGSMDIIREAVLKNRPSTTDIVPGTQLHHFIYKSKAHVQFTMSSFAPYFNKVVSRRR